MTYIYLLRHGRTVANEQKRYIGTTDSPLLQSSIDDIKALPRKNVDAAFCSPAKRCIDTAAYAGYCEPSIDSLLREAHFGTWEQKTFDELSEQRPEEVAEYVKDPFSYVFPGGESICSVAGRIADFKENTLLRSMEKGNDIAVIGHAGPLRLLLLSLLGIPADTFWNVHIANATYTVLSYSPSESSFFVRLEGLNLKCI